MAGAISGAISYLRDMELATCVTFGSRQGFHVAGSLFCGSSGRGECLKRFAGGDGSWRRLVVRWVETHCGTSA
jgi:hypothetical protein